MIFLLVLPSFYSICPCWSYIRMALGGDDSPGLNHFVMLMWWLEIRKRIFFSISWETTLCIISEMIHCFLHFWKDLKRYSGYYDLEIGLEKWDENNFVPKPFTLKLFRDYANKVAFSPTSIVHAKISISISFPPPADRRFWINNCSSNELFRILQPAIDENG